MIKAKAFLLKSLVWGASILFTSSALSNPVLDNVAAGQVSIQQSPNSTVINQSSDKAIINWQSFNIGAQESTHFQQPAGGVALNRISPTQGASEIYGRLTATGQIILVNPAGLFFGPHAYVDVGGLIATTGNISNQNFLNGNYHFSNASSYPNASIINEGQMVAAQHGLIALMGPNVVNRGLIQANVGHVVLASGNAFTLNFDGSNLINFSIDEKSVTPGSLANSGLIQANGGSILITAGAAAGILDNVINMEGILEAKSVTENNGEVVLGDIEIAGDHQEGVVRVAGMIDASGLSAGQTGGRVKVTGHNVLIDEPSFINVSGEKGGGNIDIGGDFQGKGDMPHSYATVLAANTRLASDAITEGNGGNIVLWSDNVTKAYGQLSAQGGQKGGDGGLIETSSHGYLDVNGISVNTSAPSGKSGTWLLDPSDLTISTGANSNVTQLSGLFTADNNATTSVLNTSTLTTQLGSTDVTVLTGSGGSGSGSGNITVANDISWSSAKSLTLSAYKDLTINSGVTISNTTSSAAALILRANNSAGFDIGAGGVVTNNGTINMAGPVTIYYNPASTNYLATSYSNAGTGALTAYMLINNAANLQSLSNSSAAWNASNNNFALNTDIDASSLVGFTPIGNQSVAEFTGKFDGQNYQIQNLTINLPSATDEVGLFGRTNAATISNLGLVNLTLNANTTSGSVGGLVGSAVNGGTISNVYLLDSNITGGSSGFFAGVGGLIGSNFATVNNIYASGGSVTTQNGFGGGLIGVNRGFLNASYNANTLMNNGGSTYIGGIAGFADPGTQINDTYNTGPIINTGNSTYVGGILGGNSSGTLNRSYNSGIIVDTSVGSTVGGLIGINGGTVNNSFWDTDTTGISSGFGSNPATINNLTGGCFTGTCTNGGTANLTSQSTFSSSPYNWDFVNTWGIISGQSYPYLKAIYSTTPRAISGSTPASGNTTVSLAANGSSIESSHTGANGFYYFLEPNGTIADNQYLLIYLDNGATKGNWIGRAPTSGGSISGSNLTANTIQIDSSATSMSNSNLSTAIGSLADTDILYSAVGNNLTLGNATNTSAFLNVPGSTTYTVDGTIGTIGGGNTSVTFNGPVIINGASITTIQNQSYANPVTLSTDTDLTSISGDILFSAAINGGHSLFINGNSITLGNVGVNTNLSSFLAAGNSILLNGNVETSGDQSYIGPVTVGSDIALLSSNPTSVISFSSTLDSDSTPRNFQSGFGQTITFGDSIGNINPFATIELTPYSLIPHTIVFSNPTTMKSIVVASTGLQTYNDDIDFSNSNISDITFISSSDDINFNSNINGAGTKNLTVVVAGAGSTILGQLTNLSLIKNGGGNLTISNPGNSYSGGTAINGGTLTLGAADVIPDNSAVSLSNVAPTTFNLNNFNETIGSLSGGAASGIVSLGTGTLTTGDASNTTFSGLITGTGGLTKQGSGILTLANNNTYTGATNVNAGTLRLGTSNVISDSSAVTLANASGAIFDLNNFNETIASLSGGGASGGDLSLGTGTLTTGDSSNTTYNGVISGTGGINKQGSGTFTLGGTNTFSGATNINSGTLSITNNAGLGSILGGTLINAAATLDVNGASLNENLALNGSGVGGNGTLTGTGISSVNGTITLNAASTIGGTGTLSLTGVVSGANDLIKAGSGTLILSGANTYSGQTIINDGTLRLGAVNALPALSRVNLANVAGASLDLNNFSTVIASLSGGGALGGNVSLGSGILTVNNATNSTYAGIISGTGGIIKQGTGTFTLSGNNTYSGNTAINAGTLQLGASDVIADNSAVTLANAAGAIFDLNNFNETIGSLSGGGALGGNTTLGSGNLTTGDASNTLYAGVINGTGGLTKQGVGTFTLAGTNTYTGTTTIGAGSLSITNPQGLGSTAGLTSILNNGTLNLNNISVGNEDILLNNGTLDSIGTASLSGAISLSSGSNNFINANSGSVFTINGDINDPGAITFTGGGVINLVGNIGNVTPVNSVTIIADTTITGSINTSSSQTYSDPITLNANTHFQSTGGNIVFNDIVNGGFDLTVSSAGATTFSAAVGATPLNSLAVNASEIHIDGGTITTLQDQIFNGKLVLGADTTLTTQGSGSNILINNGLSGNKNLVLQGAAGGNETFTLGGFTDQNVAVNNLTVNGSGTNNTLVVNTLSPQTWNLTGSNDGNLTGIGNVGGAFNFTAISNLMGGASNDNFILGTNFNGGINGGGGSNTIVGNNVLNNWNVTGTNAGSVTGLTGGFANIQNLTGGNSGNTFTFSDGALLSGTINGGSLSNTNIIDYSAYHSPLQFQLADNIFNGTTSNNGTNVNSFANINKLIANTSYTNNLILPNKKNTVVIDAALQGYVNDPLFFNGFNTLTSTSGFDTIIFNGVTFTLNSSNSAFINGILMFFSNFNIAPTELFDVSGIIQQPPNNAGSSTPTTLLPGWVVVSIGINQNLTDLVMQAAQDYNVELSKIKINPFCSSTK